MNREQRRALRKRPMFQAHVMALQEDGKEYDLPVGPRMDNPDGPGQFCEAINRAVLAGKERRWRDARVVRVDNTE